MCLNFKGKVWTGCFVNPLPFLRSVSLWQTRNEFRDTDVSSQDYLYGVQALPFSLLAPQLPFHCWQPNLPIGPGILWSPGNRNVGILSERHRRIENKEGLSWLIESFWFLMPLWFFKSVEEWNKNEATINRYPETKSLELFNWLIFRAI